MILRIAIAVVVLVLIGAFFAFDLGDHLSLEALRAHHDTLRVLILAKPMLYGGAFFVLYVLVTALSLPVAAIMTVAAGALFGFVIGTVVVSFASTLEALLSFLAGRYLLRDWVRQKMGDRLRTIDAGVEREGALYLFTLRHVPLVPFFAVNIGMGLTRMPAWTFTWVSQLGMLAGTMIYVNAGTQLTRIQQPSDILSWTIVGSLVLLGIFPLVARRILTAIKRWRVLRGFPTPRRMDYNMVVIGAGSGGLVSAYLAAAMKAKVALVEREAMGGDCLNTGCMPSKALIRSARFFHDAQRASTFGAKHAEVTVDFAAVMERVQSTIATIAPHDSVERFTKLGVECIHGEARIIDPYTVEVAGKRLTTRAIVIATGARPLVPELPGIDTVGVLTSANLWDLRVLPSRLVVLGGGPIGCEMAQAFRRLGSAVTQIESGDRLLKKEDADISALVRARFLDEGIDIRTGYQATAFRREGDERVVICDHAGATVEIRCEQILVALGRRANVRGFGLEGLGVELAEAGTVQVDGLLRTNIPTIFAVGDVAGPFQFTHVAGHQAWYAAVNALFSPLVGFRADYSVIPRCTFTDPEVAQVGLTEADAQRDKIDYEIIRFDLKGQDRAIAEGEAYGVVKILTPPGSDRILGASIVGPHAGELLGEITLAMRHKLGLKKILGTVHAYPTLVEALKSAAGQWRLAQTSPRTLRFLEWFHAWRR